MKKQKKPKNWKKRIAITLTSLGLTVGSFFVHKECPTLVNDLKYVITDSLTETQQEKDFEKQFKVEYLGDKNFNTINTLKNNLELILLNNSEALKNCRAIIIHKPEDLKKWYVEPFLDYGGLCWNLVNIVELCNNNKSTTTHELGHVRHANASLEMDGELLEFFGETLGKIIERRWNGFKELSPTWLDGSIGAKYGYPNPYAAKNLHELVAEYVEVMAKPYSWSSGELRENPVCIKTAEILAKYGVVSQKQLENVRETIISNTPEYIKEVVRREVELMTPPRYMGYQSSAHHSEITYYQTSKTRVRYTSSNGSKHVGLLVQTGKHTLINFELKEENGRLKIVHNNPDLNIEEYFSQELIDRLEFLGYKKLLNYEERKMFGGPQ
ncbi:hypothetical protein COV11_02905 [Candidatus Woesearchaeota archaeon CG10_big_fil_rev_8_21_14_0_10_30_7]|nr:MAG: hypothetical protein COV11_02905 [Candidatus Woesearchaeota archaeon CG10_big_fil_rev_8_21_14_0_10_30_7]